MVMDIVKNKFIIIVTLVFCFTMSHYMIGSGTTENDSYRIIELLDGEKVIVPFEINSYATLSSSYTETLIDLGLGNKIVLADTDSAYLLEFESQIETLDTKKLDLNRDINIITKQKPDVILIDKTTYAKLNSSSVEIIKKFGSQIIVLPVPRNIEEIRRELDFLVHLTHAKHGQRLLANFDMKYRTIEDAYSKVEEPVTVFFQLEDKNAVTTCGKDVYIRELIRLAGGENIFDDKNGINYTTYEEIARRNPKYYVALKNDNKDQHRYILGEKALSTVDAIRTDNVYIIDSYQTSNPNHRSLDAILALGNILHNDIY